MGTYQSRAEVLASTSAIHAELRHLAHLSIRHSNPSTHHYPSQKQSHHRPHSTATPTLTFSKAILSERSSQSCFDQDMSFSGLLSTSKMTQNENFVNRQQKIIKEKQNRAENFGPMWESFGIKESRRNNIVRESKASSRYCGESDENEMIAGLACTSSQEDICIEQLQIKMSSEIQTLQLQDKKLDCQISITANI